jgi:hypothetical protein
VTVSKENVTFTNILPTDVQVDGNDSDIDVLTVSFDVNDVTDVNPSRTLGGSNSVGLAAPITVTLTPLVSGTTRTCTVNTLSVSGDVGTGTCSILNVLTNVYQMDISIPTGNGFFTGSDVSAVAVIDPSQGFVTGGGTFQFNGSRVNFGFNAKTLKSGQIQGSVLTIFHYPDGNRIVKSNSTGTLSIGRSADNSYGYATLLNWRATYSQPTPFMCGSQLATKCGGYTFTVYVEDHGEPGTGNDMYWIEVKDPSGVVMANVSLPRSGGQAVPTLLTGGNIQVPQPSSSGK